MRLPGQSGYDSARLSYNPLYDNRNPAAIALPGSTGDVQACVEAAAASRTPIAARCGGHSYAGYSTPDGAMVVDLSGMAGVTVNNDGTVTAGAGARLIDVYTAVANAGRALPGGTCPSVGIAGLALGGGLGVLNHKFGLTCDRLVSATVVTADSTVHTASASSDQDLYWALRGGGGGNFGIVTSFTFSTEPAPSLATFQLDFPADAGADALGAWQQWISGAPDELWANCNINGGSTVTVTVLGCLIGSTSTLNPMLDDLVHRVGTAPTSRTVANRDYLAAMRYYASCSSRSQAQCHLQVDGDGGALPREGFVASSRVMTSPISDPGKVIALAYKHTDLHLIIDPLGGAAGRVAVDATAFPHRGAAGTIQIYQKLGTVSQQTGTGVVAAVRDALGGMVGTGAYVNYIDATMPNWAQSYYGANLNRLQQVASRYDPGKVFGFAQGLTTA
jgi:hypothetical protein